MSEYLHTSKVIRERERERERERSQVTMKYFERERERGESLISKVLMEHRAFFLSFFPFLNPNSGFIHLFICRGYVRYSTRLFECQFHMGLFC